ncbi:glutathione synthetase [Hamiltosporidium magnivora]|uniref:Glutathione synthetase n=1 Tax=Hamiltosporidium magnivora TaxID=148818 RepID=A0A4Q9LMR5_9MICR|nr:glutathione synthetase [Hamiltosporidium magnivora]
MKPVEKSESSSNWFPDSSLSQLKNKSKSFSMGSMKNTNFKKIAISNNLTDLREEKVKIVNITQRPSKFPYSKAKMVISKQNIMTKLFYNAMQDIGNMNLQIRNSLHEILEEIRKLKTPKKIQAIFMRTDYLLEKTTGEMKQVETNVIACCFIFLGPLLNKTHSLFYEKVLISDSNKKFINFVVTIFEAQDKNYLKNKNIGLMIDNETSIHCANFHDKIEFIKGIKEKGIDVFHVKVSDLQPNIKIKLKNGETKNILNFIENKSHWREWNDCEIFFMDRKVSFVYYRWFYNAEHFDNESIIYRTLFEISDCVNLPSVELQIIGMKYFQILFKDKNILKKYLNIDEIEAIYSNFGDFKKLENFNFDDQFDYILKSDLEGGGHNIYGEDMLEIVKRKDEKYFLMKNILSPSFNNKFIDDKEERQVVCEIGIMGCLISSNGEIIDQQDCGYICRSKDVCSKECGVSCGYGALDSIYEFDE